MRMIRATDPALEPDSPAVRAAVDELMAASAYLPEDAARLIREAAALLRELRQPDRVEGALYLRLRHRPGRAASLGDVQHTVTIRRRENS